MNIYEYELNRCSRTCAAAGACDAEEDSDGSEAELVPALHGTTCMSESTMLSTTVPVKALPARSAQKLSFCLSSTSFGHLAHGKD